MVEQYQKHTKANVPPGWNYDSRFNREDEKIPHLPSNRKGKRHHPGSQGGGGDYRTPLQRNAGRGNNQV